MSDDRHMSLEGYRDLVGNILSMGYEVTQFGDVEPGQRHLILRHDIDMCLERAASLAELEWAQGWRANYFALVDTEFYNVSSRHGRSVLERIRSLGHELGLHFDPAGIPEGDVDELDAGVAAQCQQLEDCSGGPVSIVTFHRPAKWLLGFAAPLAGRLHGYMPRFFSDIGYCSDSEGKFRFGHPLDHPALHEGRALQLVTHPIWWCAEAGEGPLAKLERFLAERSQYLAHEMSLNCKPFAAAWSELKKS